MSIELKPGAKSVGLAKLAKQIAGLDGVVKIGFPAGSKAGHDGTSAAMVAAVHEFGSAKRGIPERPFLRPSVAASGPKLSKIIKSRVPKVADGTMSGERVLELLGAEAVGEVKKYIVSGSFTKLADETIARKGSSKPLIDTGNLRQAVNYEVKMK